MDGGAIVLNGDQGWIDVLAGALRRGTTHTGTVYLDKLSDNVGLGLVSAIHYNGVVYLA